MATSATPSPSSLATPAASWPMVCGSSPSIRPLRFFQSLALMPAARTPIRTWPGPGCGSGRSTISRTSGPPNWLKRAAFIIHSDLDSKRRACCAFDSARCSLRTPYATSQHAFIQRGGQHQHVPTPSIPDRGCSLLNRGFGFYKQPLHQVGGGHHVVDQSHRLTGEWEEVVATAGSESGEQLRSYSCGINAVGVGLKLTDECRM